MRELKSLRLGLSMRVVDVPGRDESRDALAHEWSAALPALLPGAAWMPLPNSPADVRARIEAWQLNGFILTGGNDVGAAPRRDQTERTILECAVEQGLPVFGVCRGLQMMVHHFGGRLQRCDDGRHAGPTHAVRLLASPVAWPAPSLHVNSYHDNRVGPAAGLPAELEAVAVDDDGFVEAVRHRRALVLGIMWHPERSSPSAEFDTALLRHFFQQDR